MGASCPSRSALAARGGGAWAGLLPRSSALLVHGALHVVDHGEAADGLQEVVVRPVGTAGPGGAHAALPPAPTASPALTWASRGPRTAARGTSGAFRGPWGCSLCTRGETEAPGVRTAEAGPRPLGCQASGGSSAGGWPLGAHGRGDPVGPGEALREDDGALPRAGGCSPPSRRSGAPSAPHLLSSSSTMGLSSLRGR